MGIEVSKKGMKQLSSTTHIPGNLKLVRHDKQITFYLAGRNCRPRLHKLVLSDYFLVGIGVSKMSI